MRARDIFESARDNFQKSARDIFFFFSRDNFQQSARDTEKVPVTNFKIKMSRPLLNVTGKKTLIYLQLPNDF